MQSTAARIQALRHTRAARSALRGALLAALALGGCASTPASRGTNNDAASEIAGTPADLAPPPRLSIGAVEPTSRTVAVGDLVRAEGSVARYEIIEGDPVGGEVVERTTRETDPTKPSILIRSEERGGRVAERMVLRRCDDGAVRLERVDSILDRSRSEFAHPLLFAAELSGERGLSDASPMTVLTLPALRKRAEGTARRTLRVVGECELSLSGERMRAIALELEFDVELDVAVASVRSRIYVVPGRGVVAEVRQESRKILGLFRTTTSETIVLRSVEQGAAPEGASNP